MNKITEEQLRAAIESDPANAELYYELAQVIYAVLDDQGRHYNPHEASKQLAKAIFYDPFNGKYHFFRAEVSAHVSSDDWEQELQKCIHLKYKVKECKAILADWDNVWGRDTSSIDEWRNNEFEKLKNEPTPENYFSVGNMHRMSDPEKSLEYFKKGLESNPDHHECLYGIAFYYYDKGMLHQSLEYFLKSLEHAPQTDTKDAIYSWTEMVYDDLGWTKEALELEERRQKEFPGDYQRLSILGEYYLKLGRLDEAEATLLEAVKDDLPRGNYHGPYYDLVMLYGQKNDGVKIKFYIDKALKQYPDSAHFHFLHGIYQSVNKDLEGAKLSYKTSILHNQEFASSYINLGKIYLHESDFENALIYLKKADRKSTRLNSSH